MGLQKKTLPLPTQPELCISRFPKHRSDIIGCVCVTRRVRIYYCFGPRCNNGISKSRLLVLFLYNNFRRRLKFETCVWVGTGSSSGARILGEKRWKSVMGRMRKHFVVGFLLLFLSWFDVYRTITRPNENSILRRRRWRGYLMPSPSAVATAGATQTVLPEAYNISGRQWSFGVQYKNYSWNWITINVHTKQA